MIFPALEIINREVPSLLKSFIKTLFPYEGADVPESLNNLSDTENKLLKVILEIGDKFNPAELLIKTDVMFNEILRVCDSLAAKGILSKVGKEFEISGGKFLKNISSLNFYGTQKFEEVSFDSKLDENFFDISAIIFKDNQFITAETVEIQLTKEDLNLVFHNGERLILNQNEKSKTIFDKFTFALSDKKLEKLFMDKDHYNTYELVRHSERDFRNHGHNKIVNYILLIIVSLIAQNIVFYYKNKIGD